MSKVASKINKKIESAKTSSKKTQNLKFKVRTKAKEKIGVASSTARKHKPSKAKVGKATKKLQQKELIIIDEAQGLIFDNEKTLFGYFSLPIQQLETKYAKHYDPSKDFSSEEISERESWLESVLDDPDEIWADNESFKDFSIYTLIKEIESGDESFWYVASVYLNSEEKFPTFVFVQFATKDQELLEIFRDKQIIYHRKLEAVQFAALEGDSLLEGDYLAIGLLESMMKLRGDKDIPSQKFKDYAEYREQTINSPDEIWRKVDSEGHVLVTFISDISENTMADLHYVVVTEEDEETQVHSLLFSFPSLDISLIDRYRQGENLEAEEVSTENSH